MPWKIVNTGKRFAAENMALDAALLEDLTPDSQPLLHFYEWEKEAATYGHFIDPKKHLRSLEIDLAKRPTGGGIIFHVADFAFSALVPANHPSFSLSPLENYHFVNEKVSQAISELVGKMPQLLPTEPQGTAANKHFCMAKPTKYDVMIGEKKIGGAAQRKTKAGYLHQGSINLGLLSKSYLERFLEEEVVTSMLEKSYAPLGEDWTESSLQDARDQLRNLLQQVFL